MWAIASKAPNTDLYQARIRAVTMEIKRKENEYNMYFKELRYWLENSVILYFEQLINPTSEKLS